MPTVTRPTPCPWTGRRGASQPVRRGSGGDKNPLGAYVGKAVTIAGTTRAGDAEVDVETVDGKALREPGKPPWAGGPWVVGPTHPGWKDWMANGKPGKGHGQEHAPGQVKKETAAP